MIPIHEDFIILNEGPPLATQDSTWNVAESGTNTQFKPLQAEPGHSGILRIRTSNASGSFGRLYKAESLWRNGTTVNQIYFDDVMSFEWVVRVPDITGMAFKLSMAESIYLTRAAAFEFDTNLDGFLRCSTYGTGGADISTITMPSDGMFHVYRVEVSASQIDFLIDGNIVASHTDSTKMPLGSAVTPYAAVFARVYAYKYIDIDQFNLE